MAVELDEGLAQGHWMLGVTYMWLRRHDDAVRSARRAIALDPNLSEGHATLGLIYVYAGRSAEALASIERAVRLDPHYNDIFLHFMGLAYFLLERFEEAADVLRRRLIRRPDTDISRVLLAATLGELGQMDEARAHWDEALRVNPSYSLEQKRKVLPFADPADFEKLVAGLRKAGLPG
jgi:tetratricopeptide (TPR) repeat protein